MQPPVDKITVLTGFVIIKLICCNINMVCKTYLFFGSIRLISRKKKKGFTAATTGNHFMQLISEVVNRNLFSR